MKPIKILIFFLFIIFGLVVLMLVYPKEGIKIGEKFVLHFITWDEFWHPKENKDITSIVNNFEQEEQEEQQDTVVKVDNNTRYDSAMIDTMLIVYKPVKISVDSNFQALEFPAGNDTLLNKFFQELGSVSTTGEKIHILHYGDSQIEVDRMTSYIRSKLQKAFGGYGSGFHLGIQPYNFRLPLVVTHSDNWYRYKIFPSKDTIVKHRRFGILTSFSKFISLYDTTNTEATAWIKFEKSPIGSANIRTIKNVKIFYSHNNTELTLSTYADGIQQHTHTIVPDSVLKIKTFTFNNPNNVKFEFIGKSSPEIYGYSFESNSGVIVDNLPVRGSGGLFLGRLDFRLAASIYANLNVKLVIMQFGGNAINGDSSQIRAYVKGYGRKLKYLKQMIRNVPIIVIGPSDMSEKEKESYVTRPNLPYLNTLIQKEAIKNNCVFWNMYEAMGGKNSMPSWVFHEPPLAEKDFIHFSPGGAKIIARMFYKSLIFEYNKFTKK